MWVSGAQVELYRSSGPNLVIRRRMYADKPNTSHYFVNGSAAPQGKVKQILADLAIDGALDTACTWGDDGGGSGAAVSMLCIFSFRIMCAWCSLLARRSCGLTGLRFTHVFPLWFPSALRLCGTAVSNLCNVLPQEKMGQFSTYDSKRLLLETQRALNPELFREQQALIELQKGTLQGTNVCYWCWLLPPSFFSQTHCAVCLVCYTPRLLPPPTHASPTFTHPTTSVHCTACTTAPQNVVQRGGSPSQLGGGPVVRCQAGA